MYFSLVVPAYSFGKGHPSYANNNGFIALILASLAYFSPTIIQGYGHSALVTQLLNIPPYFCAFVFGMTVAGLSDHFGYRFPFAMLGSCISLVGFVILHTVHSNTHAEYAALFLAAMGVYSAMPMVLCWYSMNGEFHMAFTTMQHRSDALCPVHGHAQRAVGLAFQIGAGNCGGIISAYSFLAKDAPKYLQGYSICISFTCLAIVACCLYHLSISRANAKHTAVGSSEATILFMS